jgi:hypothetical protein
MEFLTFTLNCAPIIFSSIIRLKISLLPDKEDRKMDFCFFGLRAQRIDFKKLGKRSDYFLLKETRVFSKGTLYYVKKKQKL